MSETGETAVRSPMEESRPEVTRARMIIETSDGRAVYFECRDPAKTVLEVSHGLDALPPMGGVLAVKLPGVAVPWGWPGAASSVELRIERGHGPYLIEIKADSGEIPPQVAQRALRAMDALAGKRAGALWDLRPYLARIAGTW